MRPAMPMAQLLASRGEGTSTVSPSPNPESTSTRSPTCEPTRIQRRKSPWAVRTHTPTRSPSRSKPIVGTRRASRLPAGQEKRGHGSAGEGILAIVDDGVDDRHVSRPGRDDPLDPCEHLPSIDACDHDGARRQVARSRRG